MTSETTSPPPPSLLTWLSAIETPPTSTSQHSPFTQISPSVRRKRQRSVGRTTPVHRKRRTTRSLDGLRGLIHEEASLEEGKRGRLHTRVGREPLHELRWANSAINMAVNLDVRLGLRSLLIAAYRANAIIATTHSKILGQIRRRLRCLRDPLRIFLCQHPNSRPEVEQERSQRPPDSRATWHAD